MQMSRCDDIVQNKEGQLLTYQTTVIVDITITTTLVRAAEHMGGRLFRLDVVTTLALCNHLLTLIYVDVLMLRHRLKI
jgi:hypothetical protein